MSVTGLQKYINADLDGTKTYRVDISIYPTSPERHPRHLSPVIGANVEGVREAAENILQGEDADSIAVFAFPEVEERIECFRDGEVLVCRKSPVYKI